MSEPESTLPIPAEPPRSPSRLRRFFLRHLPLSVAGLGVLLTVTVVGFYFGASSARFEAFVRNRMVAWLEQSTGGRVEIASFHWRLLHLEADADGLVIHGLEDPGEAPYAQVEHLRVRLSVLGFWSPRVLLRDLDVSRPSSSTLTARPISLSPGSPANRANRQSIPSSMPRPATFPSSRACSTTKTALPPSTFRTGTHRSTSPPTMFRCS
jgi:hypothetical protein